MEDIGPAATLSLLVERQHLSINGPGTLTPLEATPDGEQRELPRRGRTMKVKAKWDGLVLVVERELEDGPKIVDRYEAADGSRLLVARKMQLSRGPTLDLTFVYDRPSDSDVHGRGTALVVGRGLALNASEDPAV